MNDLCDTYNIYSMRIDNYLCTKQFFFAKIKDYYNYCYYNHQKVLANFS